jgi:hypothetical protein
MTPFEAARRNLAEQARLEPIALQAIADAGPPPLRPKGAALIPFDTVVLSDARAMICAMNHDPVTASLWALAGFDPALVHLAELRERFANLSEDDQIRVTLDRLTSVYVEGQCHELERAAGITTHGFLDLDPTITAVTEHILDCTSDPLGLEICAYAMRLGALTAHGTAPWKRFAAVMADCHAQLVS